MSFLAKHLVYGIENDTPVDYYAGEMRGYSNTGIYTTERERREYEEEKINMAQSPNFNLPNQNKVDLDIKAGENTGGAAASGNASAGNGLSTKSLLIIGGIALLLLLLKPSGEKKNKKKD